MIYSRLGNAFLWGVLLVFFNFSDLKAQERSSLDSLYDELDVLFAEADLPIGLLQKADSLMLLLDQRFHSIGIRSGYMSNVLTAGRDLGIDQHGFNTGLSYFHPSGMFLDISGFWNSEYDPSYYLTNIGLGYFQNFGENWTVSIGHDFMLYDSNIDFLFDKAFKSSAFLQKSHWEAGVDYRYLYGLETAHRLVGIVNGRITWKDVGKIDRISLIPGVNVQFGNANVQYYRQSETPLQDLHNIITQGDYPELSTREIFQLNYLLYKGYEFRAAQFLRERNFTLPEIQDLFNAYDNYQIVSENNFGLMNIAVNAALSVSEKNWNIFLNYTYNFPQALPGESFEYPQNDYISISLMYTLIWPAR